MVTEPLPLPPVYMAGPVDYVEHRAAADHMRDNWRHRFFGDMPIDLLCPTCLNSEKVPVPNLEQVEAGLPVEVTLRDRTFGDIMDTNKGAMERAEWFVGYFPGDVATFGTPIEVWHWVSQAFLMNRADRAVLVHPARMGVFVEYLAAMNRLVVVRTFEEARAWLQRQLLTTH